MVETWRPLDLVAELLLGSLGAIAVVGLALIVVVVDLLVGRRRTPSPPGR